MERVLVEEKMIANKKITYNIIFFENKVGISVYADGEGAEHFVPDTAENVLRLIRKMAEGNVTPVSVSEILEDIYCVL